MKINANPFLQGDKPDDASPSGKEPSLLEMLKALRDVYPNFGHGMTQREYTVAIPKWYNATFKKPKESDSGETIEG